MSNLKKKSDVSNAEQVSASAVWPVFKETFMPIEE